MLIENMFWSMSLSNLTVINLCWSMESLFIQWMISFVICIYLVYFSGWIMHYPFLHKNIMFTLYWLVHVTSLLKIKHINCTCNDHLKKYFFQVLWSFSLITLYLSCIHFVCPWVHSSYISSLCQKDVWLHFLSSLFLEWFQNLLVTLSWWIIYRFSF